MEKWKVRAYPYNLELKHPFRLATGTRSSTPIVLLEIEYGGKVGYGEASLPPYLGETTESVLSFISKVNWNRFYDPQKLHEILSEIDQIEGRNTAAKAAIDIALHDLVGKLSGKSITEFYNIPQGKIPISSYTIGMGDMHLLEEKLYEARAFKQLKIKLGGLDDLSFIERLRSLTDLPIIVDANQGWASKEEALDWCYYLQEKKCLLVEQPLPKFCYDSHAWLSQESPLPIFADESIKRFEDLERYHGAFNGVNIKLMKSTGIWEALRMILRAKELGIQVMLGCMTETSCAISAAAHLSPFADWIDLDGNQLITNDPFIGASLENGHIVPLKNVGLGISKEGVRSPAFR